MSTPTTLLYHRCNRVASLSTLTAIVVVCFMTVPGFAQGNTFNYPPSPPTLRWENDLNTAIARAEREQRPLFLHIIGNDCQPAQQMAVEVFSNPSIVAQLNANFVMVRINASENADLAQKFSVTQIPTDLIIKSNGQLLHHRTGGITAERFLDYLAFLQRTIQADKNQTASVAVAPSSGPLAAGAPPAENPAGNPPLQSIPSSVGVLPGTGMTRETVAAPNAGHDPFLQQSLMQHPSAVGQGTMTPPPGGNPLRTSDMVARPAMERAVNPQNEFLTGVAAPPLDVPPPSIAAVMEEEPAPAKKTVEVPLALEGFCAVTLCTEERWISGNPAYYTMYQGYIFRFATADAMAAFIRNPSNYVPIAMGEDIVLIVDRSKRVNGNRDFGACFQGRVFLFSSQESFEAFKARPDFYTEIALKYEMARRDQTLPLVY